MLKYETYEEHERHLPASGKFIIAHFDKDSVVVYQAFKDSIAAYAVANQRFGGEDYDFNRISWLKPSFLWMMYYSGWARKQNQENILAVRMSRSGFDEMLRSAVMTTFYKDLYGDSTTWEQKRAQSDVQLEWVSYHDLHGNKTDRKAAKVGLECNVLKQYNEEWIQEIENITPYVLQQQEHVAANRIDKVELPRERVYAPGDLSLLTKINATTISL